MMSSGPRTELTQDAQPSRATLRTTSDVSSRWKKEWQQLPSHLRPLQIIHGFENVAPEAEPTDPALREGLAALKEQGLGGVVCNVSFSEYLRSERGWEIFRRGLQACGELGLRVWLYDEKGYPSGGAGGLVLEENPGFEAIALTFDLSQEAPFALRPAYEHTHSSNNFHAARRYPNLIDDRAVRCFLEKTHEEYYRRFSQEFGPLIEAAFTDEPSLMAVNIGQISERFRKHVPVIDPIDPSVRPLPSVPWAYDLADRYRERYGEDILPLRRSLFEGNTFHDREVRRRFWGLIADLIRDRYFGAVDAWCREHKISSSGHTLAEENLIFHIPLEGNALESLRQMRIPGLDLLTSNPEEAIQQGWLTVSLPASAAIHTGGRRVMTEVSDFIELPTERGQADLKEMRATAAWQAALGVTEFTLYYGVRARSLQEYRNYTDYVGRLNALLREARLNPNVLLYYPIWDLWAEYRPVAKALTLASQSQQARRIVESFLRLGQSLVRSQIPFALADHEALRKAHSENGRLRIGYGQFDVLLVPDGAELPANLSLNSWIREGGRLLRDCTGDPLSDTRLSKELPRTIRLDPPSDRVVVGKFIREGRPIFLLVNVGTSEYRGSALLSESRHWERWDPTSGEISPPLERPSGEPLELALPARGAILFVGDASHE